MIFCASTTFLVGFFFSILQRILWLLSSHLQRWRVNDKSTRRVVGSWQEGILCHVMAEYFNMQSYWTKMKMVLCILLLKFCLNYSLLLFFIFFPCEQEL